MADTKVRPGSRVTITSRRSSRGTETPTGRAFIVGEAERGLGPTRVTSLASYERTFGGRSGGTAALYDYVDTAFAEGLAEAWISRVVGPAAEAASVDIAEDGNATDVLTVTASSSGEWGNDLTAVIEHDGAKFEVAIEWDGDEVERFKGLTTVDEAVGALDNSRYVTAAALGDGTETPEEGTFELAGGDADTSNISSTEQDEALDRFADDLGFGQVCAPDWTTASERGKLVDHAQTYGRVALLDAEEGDDLAALQTAAGETDAREAMLVSTWVEVPPIARGSRRRVPGSALVAGLIARGDVEAGTANNAPAGNRGRARYCIDVVTPFTDPDDLNALTEAGVNLIRNDRRAGGVQLYGYRSLSDDPDWVQFSQARLAQVLADKFGLIADRKLFHTVDRNMSILDGLRDALKSELITEWNVGGVFGETPDDAFSVNVDEDINLPEDIEAGNIAALVTARFSPFAEFVDIQLVRVGAAATV